MDLPDLESLRCFLAAAERQHFRSAARDVGLSPAAFSDRIKRLEEGLGAPLFDRTTRLVALTAAGERLLPEARACLERARACAAAVRADDRSAPYTLTLGTRFELGLSWLLPALPALQAAQPERTIHLMFGQSGELMRRLLAGEVDAFVSSTRLTQGGLAYAVLHPEAYAFVAAPALLAARPLREAADAAQHTLIDADASAPLFRYLLDGLGEVDAWPFAHVELMGTIAAIRARALGGHGVAVLPTYYVAEELAAGRLSRLLPEAPLREDAFRLIWREGSPRDPRLRELAEELRALPLR